MTYRLMESDRNVQISCNYSTYSINGFTLRDENGVTYSFTVAEKASNVFDNDINANKYVSWLLTRIDIPAKGSIYYDYNPLQEFLVPIAGEPVVKISYLTSQISEDAYERGYRIGREMVEQCPRYYMRLLNSIRYGPTIVNFNYMPDGRHMNDIVVSDEGQTVRKFSFGIIGSALTSLAISGQDDKERLVYGFSYTSNCPGNKTDYWGNLCNSNAVSDIGNFNMSITNYRTDKNSLRNLLASSGNLAQFVENKPTDLPSYYKIKLQSMPSGDTRKPDPPYYHGVLQSITYPNGGRTAFTYENHRFPTLTAADGSMEFDRCRQRIIEGGGFRIASITNYAADGTLVNEDHYRYGFTCRDIRNRNFSLPLPGYYGINDHVGCGEAVVDPNLLTFMSYSYSPARTPNGFLQMVAGQHSGFEHIQIGDGGAWWWEAYFSAITFRSLLGSRRPVVYPEITVYHGNPDSPSECKSKTVYSYDIYEYNFSSGYLSPFRQVYKPDTTYFEVVYYLGGGSLAYMEWPAKRHQLKSVSDYSYDSESGQWLLAGEEKYGYSEEEIAVSGYVYDSYVSRGHCYRHTLHMGAGRSLDSFKLREFYQPVTKRLGKSTMYSRTTTVVRPDGSRFSTNTKTEIYSYKYTGHLKKKQYRDIVDKKDVYSYIGEENESSDAVIAAMKSRNMYASLVSKETIPSVNGQPVFTGMRMDYAFYGDNILPSILYESNGTEYEELLQVLSYDKYGNPTEMKNLKTGMHTVYLWDAYGRYMTTMVENATLSQVQGVPVSGNSQSRHAALQVSLPNAQIQTWDCKPFAGVSSYTDVSGKTIVYEYDGLGRLKSEKRIANGTAEPEPLREYEYNYKNK